MSQATGFQKALVAFNAMRPGGSQTLALTLQHLLNNEDVEVRFAAKKGEWADRFAPATQVLWRESVEPGRRVYGTAGRLAESATVRRLRQYQEPDLVLASQPAPTMHILRFAAKVWPSARRAVLVHGTTPVEWPPLDPDFTIPLIQAAFATTHEATEMLRKELSCTVANVGNLFDASLYWGRTTETLINSWDVNGPLTFLGTLTPNKTEPLHVLLQVIAATTHTLAIVGDGPERAALEQMVLELELSSRVHFTGTLADPRRAIQRASVVVAGGRAAIEALAAGRPVVAATSDGLHGAITTENVEAARRANYTGRSRVSTATTAPLMRSAIEIAASMSEFDRRALAAEHERLGSVEPILQFLGT